MFGKSSKHHAASSTDDDGEVDELQQVFFPREFDQGIMLGTEEVR